jgi:hypothetical protein
VSVERGEYALTVIETTRRLSADNGLSEFDREALQEAHRQLDRGQVTLKDLATQ